MIERVDGAERELDVALWVDVVGHAEDDFAYVLHVAVLVDYDDALGEHCLAQRPDGAHHFACVPRIALADGDDHEVVKDSFDWQVNVDEFGNRHLHRGKKDTFDGLAHPCVFHGRFADDGGCVDGILAVGDAGEVEDRIFVGQGVEAGVVAEWAFAAQFAPLDVTLEDDLGVGRDVEVHRFALDDLDRLAAEEAGDHEPLTFGRRGDDGRKCGGRVGADGYGDFEA